MCRLLPVLLAATLASFVASSPLVSHDSAPFAAESVNSSRDARRFFSFIAIARESCDTGDAANPKGTCLASRDCTNMKGTVKAKCAQGLGVCCHLTRTCGEKITTNHTSFVNPSYSNMDNTRTNCNVDIELINKNVCQLKLEFIKMNINEPNRATGNCENDFFMVSRTANDDKVPRICGQNEGQHMYVDVDPAGQSPRLTVDLDTQDYSRQWEVKVTQIQCDSLEKAPEGCLQYHRGTSGTVQSFNYVAATAAKIVDNTASVHLARQNYRVCVAPPSDGPNYCKVEWERDTTSSFIMTGEASNAALLGTPDAGWIEKNDDALACADYLLIPGGVYDAFTYDDGTPVALGNRDRYCGSYLPKVTTSLHPFQLHVVTDDTEDATTALETNNIGFKLKYRMLPC